MKELLKNDLEALQTSKTEILRQVVDLSRDLCNAFTDAPQETSGQFLVNAVLDNGLDSELEASVNFHNDIVQQMEQQSHFEEDRSFYETEVDRFSFSRNYRAKYEATKEHNQLIKTCSEDIPKQAAKFSELSNGEQETHESTVQLRKQHFTSIDTSEIGVCDELFYETESCVQKLAEKTQPADVKTVSAEKKYEMVEQEVMKLRQAVENMELEPDLDGSVPRRPLEVDLYHSQKSPLEKKIDHRSNTQ